MISVHSKIIRLVAIGFPIDTLIHDEEKDEAEHEQHQHQLPSLFRQSESGPFHVVLFEQVACLSISSHLIYNVRKDPRHCVPPVPASSSSKAKLARDELDQALI